MDELRLVREALDRTENELRETDRLIRLYAKKLYQIQPYAQGKIGCRFLAPRGGAQSEPLFVSWKWTPQTRKEGKLRKYDILPTEGAHRYIKRYGPFDGTQSDVRLLIGIIKHLVERRKRITNLIGRFTQSCTLCARESERVRHAYELGYEGLSDEIDARHMERMEHWKAKKAMKAQQQAELDAREAIPDPDDYIDLFVLPPDPFDEEEGALPDEYLDEHGEYVGP